LYASQDHTSSSGTCAAGSISVRYQKKQDE
jgi:hypothetical protein